MSNDCAANWLNGIDRAANIPKLLDLAAIRARCDAATPGPWTCDFIAHARTDIPALLAYVHDLEQELAENDRLRDALAERALTAEERLEQMTRERDEARAQLAELATKKEKP
jgi:hypothetical protein